MPLEAIQQEEDTFPDGTDRVCVECKGKRVPCVKVSWVDEASEEDSEGKR